MAKKKVESEKSQRKQQAPAPPKVDPLSPAALYAVLASHDKGFVRKITPQRVGELYKDTHAVGITPETLKHMSGGKVTDRLPREAVEGMAESLAREQKHLGHEEFGAFIE